MKIKAASVIFLLLAVLLFSISCYKPAARQPVIAGTTMIASLVRDVYPDLPVESLVPADQCPGHYDLTPADAASLARAQLIILHPYQKPLAEKISAINTNAAVKFLLTDETTIPTNYFAALRETESLLAGYYPERRAAMRRNAESSIAAINARIARDSGKLEQIRSRQYAVVASCFQVQLCRYLGLNIVASFKSPEATSLAEMNALMKTTRDSGAAFIINNKTGMEYATGQALERALHTPMVEFSNFPVLTDNESGFISLWDANIAALCAAAGIQ